MNLEPQAHIYHALFERSSVACVILYDELVVHVNQSARERLKALSLSPDQSIWAQERTLSVDSQPLTAWGELIELLQGAPKHKLELCIQRAEHSISVSAELITLEPQPWVSLKADLTAELSTTLHTLEEAHQELQSASQAKDDFLASMSHELRTPLNAILGLSEALLESIYGRLNTEQTQSIRQISRSGEHLLALISDILDISKIRAGGMSLNITEIDVESLCSEVVQHIKPEMRRKQLSLVLDIDGAVHVLRADQRWFKQLLMNLLSNAVKFTPSGRRMGLTLKPLREQQRLRVTVWDEGIGIEPEHHERLFQPFVQLDSSLARAYEGTGLGLSIVASIMQLHGGEVSLVSALGEGSSFHLDFPWREGLELSPPTHKADPLALDKVLVVEDSVIDAEKLKRYLTELGTDVVWDATGALTITQAERCAPDLVMLDLHLPEASGLELLHKIKQHPTLSSIPVVICSVLEPSESQVPQELIAGYLVKPFSRANLTELLQRVTQSGERSTQPDSQPPQTAIIAQPHEHKAGQDTILIVDDNLSNIQLVQDYLKRKGYELLIAEDGRQAVQVATAYLPDLILMDVQMPHMDGIEATQLLKAQELTSDIPIFALTALAMPGDRERCLGAGMDEYFTKPVSLRELSKRIAKALEERA